MIKKDVKTTETTEYNRLDASANLMNLFKTQGTVVHPLIPEGDHTPIFLGWHDKEFKDKLGVRLYDGFVVKLKIGDKEYEHNMPFSAKDAEASQKQLIIYQGILTDLARQFELTGEIYIDDINKFIGREINLHVVVKEGKRYTNFYKSKPKEVCTLSGEVPLA